MFATFTLENARIQLDSAAGDRLHRQWVIEQGLGPNEYPFELVRFPVGMFFVRGDRAGPGKALSEQVVASFGYWNDDSSRYFDMLFPGWGKDGDHIVFDRKAFLSFVAETEGISRFRYSGQTDILLFNYDFAPAKARGEFAFDESILLPVEEMVRDGRIANLDVLLHELVRDAKKLSARTERSIIWDISDRIAVEKGRRALWRAIKKKFLKDLGEVYDELRPFAVCDLRLSH